MKHWLWLALFGSSVVQADMLDALKAYENKDYAAAKQHFSELVPLGNELAAFNLGAMAYQGEGQQADLSQALAYFMFATELQHPQAQDYLQTLRARASEQQLEQATLQYEELRQQLVIKAASSDDIATEDAILPVKRVQPVYPKGALYKGQFGYVSMRFLVNEQGDVTAVDTLDAFPENVFEKAAIKAIKKWQYEPSDKKHLLHVRLDFSINNGVRMSAVERFLQKEKLWEYALAGVPQSQFVLGTLLSLMAIQSENQFWYDPELPLAVNPELDIYKKRANLKPAFDGFLGTADVRVKEDGRIVELVSESGAVNATELVGLTLKGNVEHDLYRLQQISVDGIAKVIASPVIRTSRSMSGIFWWEEAAKNGNLEAQRVMAFYDKQWERYLLNQQDAEIMAWVGTQMLLDGEHKQGMVLLEQAIAKNYAPAKDMKQQFM